MKNRYSIHGDIAYIILDSKDGDDAVTLVDAEKISTLSALRTKWTLSGGGYVRGDVNGRSTLLSHVLIGPKPKANLVCDHINRDRLDNRLSNLRWVERWVNVANRSFTMKRLRGESASVEAAIAGLCRFMDGASFMQSVPSGYMPTGYEHTLRGLFRSYFTEDRLRELAMTELDAEFMADTAVVLIDKRHLIKQSDGRAAAV